MEGPDRIAPETIVRAYEVTGLEPIADTYTEGKSLWDAKQGCALVALAQAGYFGMSLPDRMEKYTRVFEDELGDLRTCALECGYYEGFYGLYGSRGYNLDGLYAAAIKRREKGSDVLLWYEDGVAAGEAVAEWWETEQKIAELPEYVTEGLRALAMEVCA